MKELRRFPTNAVEAQETTYEHIGEAQGVVNGTCEDPFLVPNLARTLCVLPGRIDIGRHFILTGGLDGLREPYERMISRVQSFGRYMFDLTDFPKARAGVPSLTGAASLTRVERRLRPG